MEPKFNMLDYTKDLLKDFARYTSEPLGIPQKPMATACRYCGDVDATVVCRYCQIPKPCDSE